jgi:hypothetical protein
MAGFLAWFTWFLLVIVNLIAYSGVMSGIFFQSGPYSLIVYGLFSASFILDSFACFGLKKRCGSNIALICGILYLVVFAILCYSIATAYSLRYIPIFTNLLTFLNLGILVWGATLLEVRKSLPYPKLSLWTGCIFIFIAISTLTLFWQALLYWGIEFWFMLFGWLYAIGAVATAIILYRLSK